MQVVSPECLIHGSDVPKRDVERLYDSYLVHVLKSAPATDRALLDEICGCLNGFAESGDPKHLRVARAHLNALLLIACIDYSTGHPEVEEMTWNGEDPICL